MKAVTLEQLLPGMSASTRALNAQRIDPGAAALRAHVSLAAGSDAPAVMAKRDATAKHAAQGKAAQASGASLEEDLDEQHDLARVLGIGDVEKLNPAVCVEQDLGDGCFVGRRTTRCGADYRGLLRGSVPIVVEAKNAGRGRLRLIDDGRPRFDGVKRHQAAALTRCLKLGGVALLVVRFQRAAGEATYVVPWDEVCDLESIGPTDVSAWPMSLRGIYFECWAKRG